MPLERKSLLKDTRTILVTMLVVQVVTVGILCYQLSMMIDLTNISRTEIGNVHKNTGELMLAEEVSSQCREMLRQRDDHLTVSSEVVETTTDYESSVPDTTNASATVSETVRRYSELLVPKSNWSSGDIKVPCAVPLQRPITKIYVKETETGNCYDYDQCKDLVLRQQLSIHTSQETDIQSNFLITGDGSIFEVLSWDCKVTFFVPDSSSILVSLLGRSDGFAEIYKVNKTQFTSLEMFIHSNLITGNLSPSYKLMPFCCLAPGRKPGAPVYSHLTYLENFHGDECVAKHFCKYI